MLITLHCDKNSELEILGYESEEGDLLGIFWCTIPDLLLQHPIELEFEPFGQFVASFKLISSGQVTQSSTVDKGIKRRKQVKKFYPRKGHAFVSMQFYQPMKCAFCSEFLLNGQGYQCQCNTAILFLFALLSIATSLGMSF